MNTPMKKPAPEMIPLTEADLSEANAAVRAMLAGEAVPTNADNPLLTAILATLADGSLKGYQRGREYTEDEIRNLPVGAVLWIRWCKDDDPDDERFNGAYQITDKDSAASDARSFVTHDGDDWPYSGDTSRGQAHYFEATKKPRTPRHQRRKTRAGQ